MRLLAALGCLLAMAAPASAAASLTAQRLVTLNLEARGGRSGIEAIRTLELRGRTVRPDGMELAYSELRARLPAGEAIRSESSLQGLSIIRAFDGRQGWRVNQLSGRREAELMSADAARPLADAARISGLLVEAGNRISYEGREDIDGTSAFKLRLVQDDGDEWTVFLDPDTYLEIRIVESRRDRGTLSITEYDLGDYEKVAGVYFPMAVATRPKGASEWTRTIFATATANLAVDASRFEPPAAAGAR